MKKYYVFIALLFFFVFSCKNGSVSSSKSEFDRSKYFSSYLLKNFSLQISDKEHFYILLPRMVCGGCVIASQEYLNQYLKENSSLIGKITFIYSNGDLVDKNLLTQLSCYYDEKAELDRFPIAMGINNLTIITTKGGEIKNVVGIIRDHYEKIDKILRK